MILAALTLIALLTLSLLASVALVARDLAVEERARQLREPRVPLTV